MSAIETLWLTAALVVPLVFSPWGENAFELPKALVLRAIVVSMALVMVMRFIDGGIRLRHPPTHRPSMWLVLPALVFGLAQIAATAFSINPRASVWGSYERQQGLLTIFSYLALFFFTAANLRTRAQVDRLLTTLIWGSAPVVLYGFVQALGLDPLAWQTDAASPVLSTVGRSNFVGSYLTLLTPVTMGYVVLTRRWQTLLLLVGQLVCLALTQARGAWIGLGVGAFAFALAWAIAGRNKTRIVVAFAGAALVFSMVALINLPSGPLGAWARIPGPDRLAGIARTSEGSSAARLTIWQATLPLAAARLWLGYGPETMRVVFGQVFPPQLVYYQGRNVPVDRAHNLWLDSAMSSGVIGLAAYVALLAGWAWVAWRGLRDARDRWEVAVWSALIAAVAGHVADLQFGFDLTTGATVFWLILAIAAALPLPNLSPTAAPGRRDRSGWLAYAFPAGAVFILIGLVCVRPLLADGAYWNSRQATESQVRQVQAERAVELWPVEPQYRAGLAGIYVARADPVAAERQLSIADQLSPNDPQIWSAWGSLYALWGDREPRRYLQAETSFRRALELAPNVATTHTALGLVLARQGRLDEGLAELERAVALDATDGVAFRHLADLYQMLGRQSESTWAGKEAMRWGGQ